MGGRGRRPIAALVMRWVAGAAAAGALAAAAAAAPRPPAGLLDFTPDEVRRIASHGPWPPPAARDPGNALAGRPAAAALGRALFFDPRLSPGGQVACVTCHVPTLAFADGRRRSEGLAPLDRNAPSLWNAVHQRWMGWDGAADSLWSQAIRPLLDPREMASSGEHLRERIAADPSLAAAWRRVFDRDAAGTEPEVVLVGTAKAIGAWVATLVSPRTPFDDFRDALQRGDRAAAARYPLDAQRGARLFVGRARCALCHVGPMFSHGEFADLGLPFFVRPGSVDPGRHGGIETLRASRYNLLSRWADPPVDVTATRHVQPQHRNFGEFKVPSLRHVAQTAPYMHDGQLATLQDVLRHYSELNPERLHADGEQILQPLGLTAGEQADLIAFLRSLSPRRWPPTARPASPRPRRRRRSPPSRPAPPGRASGRRRTSSARSPTAAANSGTAPGATPGRSGSRPPAAGGRTCRARRSRASTPPVPR
jgi:cytochrome c peroxidase